MTRVDDGDTPTDAVIQSNGSVLLRSERSGNGDGRVYAITYTATTPLGDDCIDKTVKVGVPHDRARAPRSSTAGSNTRHISELVGAMKKPLATGVEAALLTVGAAPAAAEFIIQERDGVLYVKNVEPPAAAVTSKPRGGAASAESYRALIRETAERPATVTASVTAADKTYDGTTVATITACTLSGVVAGDAVTCAAGSASFSDPNPGPNKAVTATGVTLSGAAAGNYQLSSTTATTTASIIYGFAGLQSPYLLPSQGAFQIKSAIPLKWQYLNNAGSVINSSAAGPVVGIAGPYTCGGDDSLAPVVTANDAGNSGYKYDSTTNTWQFNWKTTGLTAGCYTIKIHSGQSGQENGPFPIQLKSK